MHELKSMKGAVSKTKVNVNRLKVYKFPDECKESNEKVAADSEKITVEENRTEDGSNERVERKWPEMKRKEEQMLNTKRMEVEVDQMMSMERKVQQTRINQMRFYMVSANQKR